MEARFDERCHWQAVLAQDAEAMRGYFLPEARVRWPNTNEQFTAEEFICANCEYPGRWAGEIERAERAGSLCVTAVRVWE